MERRILVERLHYVVPITDVSTLDEGIKKDKKITPSTSSAINA
jgi:hypothetical protein